MTSDAERDCYYRLAKEAAPKGTIIELGPWLGASTAYIAAGIRDSGVERKALVFDRFKLNSDHLRKLKKWGVESQTGPCLEEFKANLGGLMKFVEPRPGQIEEQIKGPWAENSVSLLVADAPKRVPQISAVLTALRNAIQPGSIMAWQDFCHFPSYEIPACLYRIRQHLEFVEAVVPGTTMVFRVKSQWPADEVSLEALALSKWTLEHVIDAWAYWEGAVADEKRALFACGASVFLCDIGHPKEAVELLARVYGGAAAEIVNKWRYLKETRPDFLTRYAPLFAYLGSHGAI